MNYDLRIHHSFDLLSFRIGFWHLSLLLISILLIAFARVAGAESVTLQWTPPLNASESGIARYQVGYGRTSGRTSGQYEFYAEAMGATTSTTTIDKLEAGNTYWFAVRSRDHDGTLFSAFSNEVSATSLSVNKSGDGSGTVGSQPTGIDCGTDCNGLYASGTLVTLKATPDTGSTFTGWSGGADCTDGQVRMDAVKTCTATFERIQHNLIIGKDGTGAGAVTSSPMGISCGSDCDESYAYGTRVTLTATPDTSSIFAGWSGDADCTDGLVTMDAAKACTATFNDDTQVTLTLAMTDSLDPVSAGSPLTYTLSYANDSMVTVNDVILQEYYDGNVSFHSANPPPDVDNDQWNLGTLQPGDSGTITVIVEVASDLPNGAELLNHIQLFSDRGIAQAHESTVVEKQPLLALTKSDTDPVIAGTDLVYTLTYSSDAGANASATNVVLTETYDPDITFVSASPPPDEGDNVWRLGDLAPGDSGLITVTMRAASPLPNGTQLRSDAELSCAEGASASAGETTTVHSSPVLNLAKGDTPDPVHAGTLLTYALTYGNDSGANETATNVVLRETYDPNVSFERADPAPDAGTDNQWTLGDLAPGEAGSVNITVQVATPLTDGTLLSTTAVVQADQGSASAEETTTVASDPQLQIRASDDPDPVQAGTDLTYLIDYGNDAMANETATNVVLRATYDPGISFVSADPAPDAGTDNQWTLGELPPDHSGTLTIEAQVDTLVDGTLLTTTLALESDQAAASTEETTTINTGAGPEAPFNFTAKKKGMSGGRHVLACAWDHSGVDVHRFEIYRDGVLIGSTTGLEFNYFYPTNGEYYVIAVDAAGSESDASESVWVKNSK